MIDTTPHLKRLSEKYPDLWRYLDGIKPHRGDYWEYDGIKRVLRDYPMTCREYEVIISLVCERLHL